MDVTDSNVQKSDFFIVGVEEKKMLFEMVKIVWLKKQVSGWAAL